MYFRSTSVLPPSLSNSCVGDWQLGATTTSSFSQYESQPDLCFYILFVPPSSESKLGAGGSSIPFQQWDGSRCCCSPPFPARRRHLMHSHNLPMHMQLTMTDSGRAKRWRGHTML